MVDSVIAGTGNSRYLRTSLSASTTWEDALTMLRAGTFPIDLAGINQTGFTTLGTALNSATLLKSAVITALGLSADATPSDAWEAVIALIDDKADEDSVVTAVTYNSNTKELTATINGTATVVATFDFVNATEAANAAPVQSVAGKTGNVTLDGGNISYDDSATYPSGSVGAEVSDLKSQIDDAGENILAAFPTDSMSGALVNFPDGADSIPVKALTVSIRPVQSGSGDPSPSNVRPISGWTGVKLTRSGTNMISPAPAGETELNGVKFTSNGDGTYKIKGTASGYTTFAVNVEPFTIPISVAKGGNGVMVLNNSFVEPNAAIGFYYNGTIIDTWTLPVINRVSNGYSAMGGKLCNKWTFYIPPGASVDGTIAPMFRSDGLNTSGFVPFTGYDVVEVTWQSEAGTVYGGTLDVTGGKMTVDRAMVDLGTLQWNYDSANTRMFTTELTDTIKRGTVGWLTDLICSQYKTTSGINADCTISEYASTGYVYIRDTGYTDAALFKAAMSGVQLVYPLAAPFEIALTPTEVSTLLGTNNVWADAGDVDLIYRADPTLYIRKLTGPAESDMVADANIASGQYFMVGNRLFLATAAIAAGAALTVGTNCTETNLAAALNALNS